MDVKMNTMHSFDWQSILGSFMSLSIMSFGLATLNAVAVAVGIVVGITTIRLNILKTRNEKKRSKVIDKAIHLDNPDIH